MKTLLSGNVLWASELEVQQRTKTNDLSFHITGVKPFHCHSGEIFLDERALRIMGNDVLTFSFDEMRELYLGFDEIYTPSLSKNFGLFWQPLRLTFTNKGFIYLIIDYNLGFSKNKLWFNTISELLS
ncbi:MAG: hypothetical protein EOP00_17980 [Pedobacter sp.]|nr:MAG: hypothetical protein EOP00_17980 [Pedobacter sp.]